MKSVFSLLLAFALFASAGCADQPFEPANAQGSYEVTPPEWVLALGSFTFDAATEDAGVRDAATAQLDAWTMDSIRLVDDAVGAGQDWRTAAARVQVLLDSEASSANPIVAELASVALLKAHLLPSSDADANAEIERHTERLIDLESAETGTIADGLERIRTHTSPATLKSLALRALEGAERRARRCADCGPSPEVRLLPPAERRPTPALSDVTARLDAIVRATA